MSGNTLQYAETPDGLTALHAGTWHWLKDNERNASWDLIDASITTAWETCDLSGRVPPGTVAIFGNLQINSGDIDDIMTLFLRPYGSAETDAEKVRSFGLAAEIGALTSNVLQCPCPILAPNGKFQYANQSATQLIGNVLFELWGYMI